MDCFPVKINGAERPRTNTFLPTKEKEVGTLITKPNKIKQIRANDKWQPISLLLHLLRMTPEITWL